MSVASLLFEQLALAERLRAGRSSMTEPQDLPGRFGRVVRAVDRVLLATGCMAVVGGGWAVWRHGYVGRVTQDLDIALPADRVADFLQAAAAATGPSAACGPAGSPSRPGASARRSPSTASRLPASSPAASGSSETPRPPRRGTS
jgi:hypothetical protein